jgi:starch synthase (maltosyl-transferring)
VGFQIASEIGVRGRSGREAAPKEAPRELPLPRGWARPVVRDVQPQVDEGRRPAKTTVGERLSVQADAFVDGHDPLWCELRYRHELDNSWTAVPMTASYDDRWQGIIAITDEGLYHFAVRARVDAFAGWRDQLMARAGAGQDLSVPLEEGARVLEAAAGRAGASERTRIRDLAGELRAARRGLESQVSADLAGWLGFEVSENPALGRLLRSERLALVLGPLADPATATTSKKYLARAERARARCSAWYEMFPRSASSGTSHGTLADVRARLDYVERMGFDVLYLPPIHPIGRTARKGRDSSVVAEGADVGSPWAIGAVEGGHTSIHPELGTFDDFRDLLADASSRGIEIALDLAFQASPDHPWVREHPSWFRQSPDGSIRHAENPPKKYEDIYPFDFESPDWPDLWTALLDVVRFWIERGVRIFRVDNPHTKPFAFWEWLIACVRADVPEVIFLAEAFTRPRVMEHLARIGFSQSYTYFTWRTSKWELETYLSQLTAPGTAAYFRPNLWPNTPDILPAELVEGGRGAFLARLVLAATLSASYGIYGPVFELQEHIPRQPGSEEYLRSEKYEIRSWDLASPTSLAEFVASLNLIRREHEALQFNDSLRFHGTDNDALIAYSKARVVDRPKGPELDVVLVVVNLDHRHARTGWVTVDLGALGFVENLPYVAHDLLTGAHYVWRGPTNFVRLDPADVPCHVFALIQRDVALRDAR